MKFEYKTSGTCSRKITLDIENGILRSVEFEGGCNGNLKGICQLLKGMKAEDAITRMKGTTCGSKPTSCPDQISLALQEALERI